MYVDVSKKVIIDESQISIMEGMRYFVLGPNGCGKTTLLNYLYSKIKEKTNIQNILMLEQHIEITDGNMTCLEYILKSELYTKYLELIELEMKEITNINYFEELSNYVYNINNFDKVNATAQKILVGLGINKNDKVSLLSGGWKMRLSLGKSLLLEPDILILDEPTNHLDLNATIWLNNYLLTYSKTLVVASHNIGFIENVANVIWYISNQKINIINGKYYKYKLFIEQEEKEILKKYETYQKKLTEIRNRKKPKPATKTEIDEFIKKEHIERPPLKNMVIDFGTVSIANKNNVIDFRDVSFTYNVNNNNNNNNIIVNNIFKNINFGMGINDKIILVGANGAGKTTFFKLCLQAEKETGGFIYRDERVKIAYYNQNVIENIPTELTPIEYLNKQYNADITMCRNYLGKVGLKDKNVCNLQINKLSGGQKARVALCSIQMTNPNIILMDEPTNHLDIDTIEELINGINNFDGGFIIVTHDTYLIENINNAKIYHITNNDIKYFKDDFDKYCEMVYSQ